MRCPFTGKPCLLPKEVFVTEVHENGVKHLNLCRSCGDKYIETLDDNDIINKVYEVTTTEGGVSQSEKIIPREEEMPVIPPVEPRKAEPDIRQQIITIERKLKDAVEREDYDSASALRDILVDLKKEEGQDE